MQDYYVVLRTNNPAQVLVMANAPGVEVEEVGVAETLGELPRLALDLVEQDVVANLCDRRERAAARHGTPDLKLVPAPDDGFRGILERATAGDYPRLYRHGEVLSDEGEEGDDYRPHAVADCEAVDPPDDDADDSDLDDPDRTDTYAGDAEARA